MRPRLLSDQTPIAGERLKMYTFPHTKSKYGNIRNFFSKPIDKYGNIRIMIDGYGNNRNERTVINHDKEGSQQIRP